MLQGKTVTIFGGSGFLGRHIVRRLAKAGMTIRVPTRDFEQALILKPMGDVGQIVPLPVSLKNDASVRHAIGRSDVVINLIGILFEKKQSTFQNIHVELAARLARLAREQEASQFIHVSALGADAQSQSAYARSKMAGEQAVRAFFAGSIIMRPSILYGPDDHFFNLFSNLARFSPVLPLIGGGMTKFQPAYVGDVADAVLTSLTDKKAEGETFELGGPRIYTFRELILMMLALTDRKRCLINIPWSIASFKAAFYELMPHPLLTRDQVRLLKTDNIVSLSSKKTFADLGIEPMALETMLPSYLEPAKYQSVHPTM